MKSLIAPILTEKSASAMDRGLYVFAITAAANKKTVEAEIKAVYKVEPSQVRIVNLPAKAVSFKRRKGLRSVRRKAYVQLPPKTVLTGFESLKENKKEAEKAAKESK